MSYYEEILNNKTMQVVWYAAERKKEKKKGRQAASCHLHVEFTVQPAFPQRGP